MKEILRQLSEFLRSTFLILLVLAAGTLAVYRLMMLQIVATEEETPVVTNTTVYSQVMPATRGEIVDCTGKPIVSNKIGYNLIIEKAYFPYDNAEGNDILLRIVRILQEEGYTWNDSLPISTEAPYTFTVTDEDVLEKLKSDIKVNSYATAENCVQGLIADYAISDSYTQQEQRILAGIRYEMLARSFSMSNVFYLANDVDIDTVTRIKEMRLSLKGVNIVEEAIRTIEQGDVIPHEIGYVGPIYSEDEYKTLLENGHDDYELSDTVGKSGLEAACESSLRGINGTKEITVTGGDVTSVAVTEEPVGGQTIQLTLNSDFQRELQILLSDYCTHLRNTEKECRNANCGAISVLDTKDNAVLGLATAPSYDLNDFLNNYSAILNAPNTPLVNRATDGMYRPGSTFKTITATAGLNEGIISGNSTFYCNRNYKYIDTMFHCTGTHHYINVSRALTVSCNIFFYETGLKLGIDRLVNYEQMYGLGSPLGLESGDSGGYLACPETFDNLGIDWYVGEITQAAIGQSEIQVTPLQMSVVASTIANEGVRYQPHLIQSVWNNAMTEKIEDKAPVIAQTIPIQAEGMYNYIEQGMIGAAQTAMPAQYDLNKLGFQVAIKTGTPQSPRGTDSFVIGYAPAQNPEIAFCAMVEGGKNAKYMVRQILDLYAKYYPDTTIGRVLNKGAENGTENGTD
ncbi:MAG: hypothetical protein MJ062_00960 [Oscillospiraceae bacterium]|nr:hypothetical protein [Oscillospiraceae bacterium]